jgi:molybdopterin-binding protein
MKYGARNQLVGKVVAVKKGAVMCQVTLKVKGPVTISSVMTLDSLKELGIKKGSKARALVKAVNVLLASE